MLVTVEWTCTIFTCRFKSKPAPICFTPELRQFGIFLLISIFNYNIQINHKVPIHLFPNPKKMHLFLLSNLVIVKLDQHRKPDIFLLFTISNKLIF